MSGPRLSGPGPSPGISLVAGGSGSLTSTALVTGGGGGTLQTPSATSTLDSSGNMSLPGRLILSAGATTSAQTDLLINPTTKASGNLIDAQVNSVSRFSITSAGVLTALASLNGTELFVGTTGRIGSNTLGAFRFQSDGVVSVMNTGQTDFNRLQLGGTTSSFPAIKRNSTAINFRLADDSGDAPITAGAITASGNVLGGTVVSATSMLQVASNFQMVAVGSGRVTLYSTTNNGLNQLNLGPANPATIGTAPVNGQTASIVQAAELLTIAAAASTTTTMLVPAGAIVLSVSVRVTTIIPTAATFTVTIGASGSFNTVAVPVAATTTDQGTALGAKYIPTAAGVTITPNLTPGAATGVVRITVSYILITPPTS